MHHACDQCLATGGFYRDSGKTTHAYDQCLSGEQTHCNQTVHEAPDQCMDSYGNDLLSNLAPVRRLDGYEELRLNHGRLIIALGCERKGCDQCLMIRDTTAEQCMKGQRALNQSYEAGNICLLESLSQRCEIFLDTIVYWIFWDQWIQGFTWTCEGIFALTQLA